MFLKNIDWLELQGVSQKTEVFITAAVRTANPTESYIVSTTKTRSTVTKT
jgi:hypothetical protein